MPSPPRSNSPRRPRPSSHPSCHLCHRRAPSPPATYILPPPVAAGVIALVSVSLTVALRTLLSRPTKPSASPLQLLSRLRRHLQARLRTIVPPRPPPPAPTPPPPPAAPADPRARLDGVRDRVIAQLDNERFAFATALSHNDYVSLPALQRRELLATAFAEIANAPPEPRPPPPREDAQKGKAVGQEDKDKVVEDTASEDRFRFLKIAESVNGRAAALGFVLCLAREVVEPGHPSLVDQVVDVVVPLAQKTPPFLVAVVDQIVDLLT